MFPCLHRSSWSVRGSCGLSLEELHLTSCCSSSLVPTQPQNIRSVCSWSSVHCHILRGIHIFLFSFSQSLKSDEEAESAKEPQNELFEARGKATESWSMLPTFDQCFEVQGARSLVSEPAMCNFLGSMPSGWCPWRAPTPEVVPAGRWSLDPQHPLRSDP